MIPKWCIEVNGELRGAVTIMAPKSDDQITSFSLSPAERYKERFRMILRTGDVRDLFFDYSRKDKNAVILLSPNALRTFTSVCNWADGHQKSDAMVLVSWQKSTDGSYYLVEKVVDESYVNSTPKELKGAEISSGALLSVWNGGWVFDRFVDASQE